MDYKALVKAGYDTIAAQYLATRTQDSADVRLLAELIPRLPPGAPVLDAGCGAGQPVTLRLSQHFQVTGVDFSAAQLELAHQAVPAATFICQDMTQLAFPDENFAAITSYYAIIHIPRHEHRPLLENFWRMLKPGGLALLCLGAHDIPGDADDDYLGEPMYWSHYDAATYRQMLLDCGYKLIFARIIADETSPGSGHLFVLAQKPPAETDA